MMVHHEDTLFTYLAVMGPLRLPVVADCATLRFINFVRIDLAEIYDIFYSWRGTWGGEYGSIIGDHAQDVNENKGRKQEFSCEFIRVYVADVLRER